MKTTTMMLLVMAAALSGCEAVGDPAPDCSTNADCGEDQVCEIPGGETVGTCVVACTADDQCASGSCDVETSRCDEIAPI